MRVGSGDRENGYARLCWMGMRVMRWYRCYFLDREARIAALEVVECSDDDEARLMALKMLRERSHHFTVEVWDQARRILCHDRDTVGSA